MSAVKNRGIYQLKLMLIGIAPSIWRRVHVGGGYTLAQLHRVLQVVMGWKNYHDLARTEKYWSPLKTMDR